MYQETMKALLIYIFQRQHWVLVMAVFKSPKNIASLINSDIAQGLHTLIPVCCICHPIASPSISNTKGTATSSVWDRSEGSTNSLLQNTLSTGASGNTCYDRLLTLLAGIIKSKCIYYTLGFSVCLCTPTTNSCSCLLYEMALPVGNKTAFYFECTHYFWSMLGLITVHLAKMGKDHTREK